MGKKIRNISGSFQEAQQQINWSSKKNRENEKREKFIKNNKRKFSEAEGKDQFLSTH